MALPWYKFYPADWHMSDTRATMTLAERGAFRDLIDIHMEEHSISANPKVLANRLGVSGKKFAHVWPRVKLKFRPKPDDPDRLVNDKCLLVLEEQRRYSEAQASRARGPKTEPQAGPDSDTNEPQVGRKVDTNEPQVGRNGAEKGFSNVAQPLYPQQTGEAAAEPQRTEQSQSQNRTEEETTGTHTSVGAPTDAPPSSFSNSHPTDRPTPPADSPADQQHASAGVPSKWKPSEADAASLASLMAETTGKADERFAASMLQLAVDGSAATYGEVADCVRDAAANSNGPIRKNSYFRKCVAERFAPDAPVIGNGDLAAAANGLRMDRPPSAAQKAANEAHARRQIAELKAKAAKSSLPGYEEFQRAAEAAAKGSA